MTTQSIRYPTLGSLLWTDSAWVRHVVLIAVGVALLTLSAKIKIPFYPVPVTMQTFVVLAFAMACGWRLGSMTLLSYLACGATGLPVFAGTPEKGIGIAYMLGPTGGYLLGFVLAAAVVGCLAERGWDRKPGTTFLAMLAGNVVIYVPGLIWLGSVVGWDKPVLAWGLTPFVLGDLAKIVLAMIVLPAAWKLVGRRDRGSGRLPEN
ncbi:MAG: biotin transporter BioY [Gammaproteobacteria bacterium]|nr:biotin transporter BioY [Gammaproteobacteria bacterium]MYD75484.1 biotin transporter BioY [Gammaproteobacteria bacterium]MYJ51649.1 biotin transporter BioY [Gammaproteobacteria bacterium]